ncbi:MAG: PilZ domain-containing protein [Deltaproteobacteria bacterium]
MGHFRLGPRYPLPVRVEVRRQNERSAREVQATTENLGFGGAFVRIDPPLSPDTRVLVGIATVTTWEPLKIPGTVRWVRDGARGVPPGVGVAFDPLTPEQALALHRLFGAHGFEEE